MNKCLTTMAALAMTLAIGTNADAATGLVGKWQAQAMKMKDKTQPMPPGLKVVVEFTKDGKFIGTMEANIPDKPPQKKVEEGTYVVKGRTLTTKAKKTETMTWKIKGRTLELTKAKRAETLILQRVD